MFTREEEGESLQFSRCLREPRVYYRSRAVATGVPFTVECVMSPKRGIVAVTTAPGFVMLGAVR